jgi:hypothetical protein
MYPPHVTDEAIRSVIGELAHGEQLPSGAMLRAVLKQRFGSPGGVSRIYRLLSDMRSSLAPPRIVPPTEVLEHELRAMRERAERAEQREEVHQSRWAVEVDQLRVKVAALEPLAHQARTAIETAGLLRRQLQAAETRIALLEEMLLAGTRTEGEGG